MSDESKGTDPFDQNNQSAANQPSTAATNGTQATSDQSKVEASQTNELQSSNESLADQPDGNKTSKGKRKKKNKNKAGQSEQSNDKMSEPVAGEQSADQPVDVSSDKLNLNADGQPDKTGLDKINIQINASAASSNSDAQVPPSDANDEQNEQSAAVNAKSDADAEDEAKESINEETKLLENDKEQGKQTNGHPNKQQNGKQTPASSPSSTQDLHEGIPKLLLTENNRPNNSGILSRLIVAAILLFKFVTFFIIKFIALFHPAKRNRLPPINEPLLLLTAGQISEKIKSGELKCEHVIRAYIHRIETVQPTLNAVIDDCFEEAIKLAKQIDEQIKDPKLAAELKKLPLLGVPFTCKDSIAIKGLAWTAGVKIRKGIKADKDAIVISNMRKSGAIPLCLTNTPELVLWYDSDNKLYGRTNNPYDLSRIVGGSSGGEGCLISAAGSLVGIGSDVAGSIRIPSMFCGTFGHKTIKRYVPVDGMFPKPPTKYGTFLCYGPIARYASDLPIILRAMSGGAADELRLDEPVDFKKVKIYYMEQIDNPLTSFVDQRILNAMQKAIKHFKDEYGAQVEKININKFKYSLAFFGTVCIRDEMRIEDYVSRTGKLNVYLELLKSFFGKSDVTRPILVQIINQNSPYCDPNSKSYARFVKMLEELKPMVHELLSDNAVLMIPTWPTLAPKHQTTILRGFDAAYTSIMNALEICATHCPMGYLTKSEALPIGFSVAAGPGQDRISIAFAKEIERKFGGWVPPPGHP